MLDAHLLAACRNADIDIEDIGAILEPEAAMNLLQVNFLSQCFREFTFSL